MWRAALVFVMYVNVESCSSVCYVHECGGVCACMCVRYSKSDLPVIEPYIYHRFSR